MKYALLYTLALLAPMAQAAGPSCVAGVPQSKPDSLYTLSEDKATVTDHRTGLTWLRCAIGQSGDDCSGGTAQGKTWPQALEAAAQANQVPLLGHSDWRVPNIKELRSLVEQCWGGAYSSINHTLFPNDPKGVIWSSTVSNRSSGTDFQKVIDNHAWVVDFSGYGQALTAERSHALRIYP